MVPSFILRDITQADIMEIARMNLALIADEGSDNPMGLPELEQRMAGFLESGYEGVLILADGMTAGYCLWRPEEGRWGGGPGVYLRQYYIKPEYRRQGLGRSALSSIIREQLAGAAFIELDVLECNEAGKEFWESVGFKTVYRRLELEL